jgi:hypothetical protein
MAGDEHLIEWIKVLLWVEWDPIGVNGYLGAYGEYDSYAPRLAAMLTAGATTDAIAAHLLRIERERMGLNGNPARADRVALRLQAIL